MLVEMVHVCTCIGVYLGHSLDYVLYLTNHLILLCNGIGDKLLLRNARHPSACSGREIMALGLGELKMKKELKNMSFPDTCKKVGDVVSLAEAWPEEAEMKGAFHDLSLDQKQIKMLETILFFF